MRYRSIDALRMLCAFMIVCIHIPPKFMGGGYWIAVCRIAVPIFLMISGYFYNKESAIKQIKKIGFLFIEANLLYGVWSCFYGVVSGVYPIINGNSILKFIFLNESPFSGHLWYLGALLYTQIFVYTVDQIRMKKVLYLTIPILLVIDIAFGKYSLLLFGREFDYVFIRNWIFVGIPFYTIGLLLREKGYRIGSWGVPVFILTTDLERYLLVANGLNATRDQYISTTFLSIAVFSVALEYRGSINECVAKVGREYSTWLYIVHPIFIKCLTFVAYRMGIHHIWGYIGSFVVFTVSFVFVAVVTELSRYIMKNRMTHI